MNYDNTNTFVLFKNNQKRSENSPDYTGKINVDGQELRLAAWLKEGKNGKFFSGKVSEFQQTQHEQEKSNGYQKDGLDDGIPF